MGFFKKIFGLCQPAPQLPIHPDDKKLVTEYDLEWWSSLTLDDCKSLERQDNVARLALYIKLREQDGLSEEEAARRVRKAHLFYYDSLEQREDEPLGFKGADAKLPYIVKDSANKAIIKFVRKMSKSEIEAASSMNAIIRKLLASEIPLQERQNDSNFTAEVEFEEVIDEEDPIIRECLKIADSYNFNFNNSEWKNIKHNRDLVTSSSLGGAFVHTDVFRLICLFNVVYDGLFMAGIEAFKSNKLKDAITSLQKARLILRWPTVLYGLGLTYKEMGDIQKSDAYFRETIASFKKRVNLLNQLIPESLPSKQDFITMLGNTIDKTHSSLLGFTNIRDILQALQV